MKKSFLPGALLAAALLATGAAAATPDTPITADTASTVRPVPVQVVAPTGLPSRFKDATVKLTFIIDAAGNVHDVAPVGFMPEDLKQKLLPVIAQWKFQPMLENGRAVPVRAIFPLTLGAES
ncbi:energy transducer TonB [Opitutus terrae]|uniref:TonB C-terminal domain-containing protein n=1 Tax=Opitutus terrae (strain DSM 11246 / JCM 15787 / PB90-1) TaxID=452637 RepID=B1ZXS8_OPITP|nr:energy transducer TonB [Opitutus terrae]ACB74300.1 hypothetical protein Oter_1012 [Opitutus terrae PB90-1]